MTTTTSSSFASPRPVRRLAGSAILRRRGRAMVGGILIGGLAAAFAFAAPGSSAQAQNNRRGGPRVIQLDEIRIEGRVQKPNAFYILNRSNLGYEVEDLRANFMVRNVLESVGREEF